jgi:hypothetical protein
VSFIFSDGGLGADAPSESYGSIFGGIGKILEPLAVGGALAYGDYNKSQMQKRDLKSRKNELAAVLAQREKEAYLQSGVAKQKSITDQARSALRNQSVQIVAAGLVTVGVLGTVGYLLLRKRK